MRRGPPAADLRPHPRRAASHRGGAGGLGALGAATTCSRVGTRNQMVAAPIRPSASTTPTSTGVSRSVMLLTVMAATMVAVAACLARRGMPRPSRWSLTRVPTRGRSSTHCSNRGLDRLKHQAATMKNTVVSSPENAPPTMNSTLLVSIWMNS